MSLVLRLRAKSSKLYGIRERVGYKQKVYIMTRQWDSEVGLDDPTDTVIRVIPTPGIQDLGHRRMVMPHGDSITGDIVLKGIAFDKFTEKELGNIGQDELTERFYLIDEKTYSINRVTQSMVSWSVVLTKMNVNYWDDVTIPNN